MLEKLWQLRNRKNKKGFTLIEMIVVIAIIAVLIALVAPLMSKYLDNAKTTRATAAAKSIYTAAQAYNNQKILTDGAGLTGTGGKVADSDVTEILKFIDNTDAITDISISIDSDSNITEASCKVDGKPGKYPA